MLGRWTNLYVYVVLSWIFCWYGEVNLNRKKTICFPLVRQGYEHRRVRRPLSSRLIENVKLDSSCLCIQLIWRHCLVVILTIRLPWNRLVFMMKIHVPVRWHLYTETVSCLPYTILLDCVLFTLQCTTVRLVWVIFSIIVIIFKPFVRVG